MSRGKRNSKAELDGSNTMLENEIDLQGLGGSEESVEETQEETVEETQEEIQEEIPETAEEIPETAEEIVEEAVEETSETVEEVVKPTSVDVKKLLESRKPKSKEIKSPISEIQSRKKGYFSVKDIIESRGKKENSFFNKKGGRRFRKVN